MQRSGVWTPCRVVLGPDPVPGGSGPCLGRLRHPGPCSKHQFSLYPEDGSFIPCPWRVPSQTPACPPTLPCLPQRPEQTCSKSSLGSFSPCPPKAWGGPAKPWGGRGCTGPPTACRAQTRHPEGLYMDPATCPQGWHRGNRVTDPPRTTTAKTNPRPDRANNSLGLCRQ